MMNPLQQQISGWEGPIVESEKGASFFANNIARSLIAIAFLPTLANVCLLVYFIRPTGMLLVLHYNVYFGVDLLGVWWQAYVFPVFGLFFFIGHLFLAKYFYQRTERIAAYLLLLASGLIGFGALIASIAIILINY
jgi:hypothetical protein